MGRSEAQQILLQNTQQVLLQNTLEGLGGKQSDIGQSDHKAPKVNPSADHFGESQAEPIDPPLR